MSVVRMSMVHPTHGMWMGKGVWPPGIVTCWRGPWTMMHHVRMSTQHVQQRATCSRPPFEVSDLK